MFRSSSPLYASPSIVEGIARSIDMGGTLDEYNISTSPESSDYNALMWDWAIVGESLYEALHTFASEQRDATETPSVQKKT